MQRILPANVTGSGSGGNLGPSLGLPPCLGEGVHCCIGHADTAAIVGRLVGRPGLKANRESVTLEPGDVVYIAQLMGGRLPEGATTLPEGFEIVWYEVAY